MFTIMDLVEMSCQRVNNLQFLLSLYSPGNPERPAVARALASARIQLANDLAMLDRPEVFYPALSEDECVF